MASDVPDLAQVRLDNALALFDAFVRATVKHPDASPLRGLDGLFAERLQIQPSYWSQIKSRSRQIGERLARQFEQRCSVPAGWLDEPHAITRGPVQEATAAVATAADAPQGDDERFIVGLVLTCFRRDPQRIRARLLDLVGEALQAPAAAALAPVARAGKGPAATGPDAELWLKARGAVAPLKRRR